MKFIRVVIAKGNQVHHLNTDMSLERFEEKMGEGKQFVVGFEDYHRSLIFPSEVISWYVKDSGEGVRPTFMY